MRHLECRVQSVEYRVQSVECRVESVEYRVQSVEMAAAKCNKRPSLCPSALFFVVMGD